MFITVVTLSAIWGMFFAVIAAIHLTETKNK